MANYGKITANGDYPSASGIPVAEDVDVLVGSDDSGEDFDGAQVYIKIRNRGGGWTNVNSSPITSQGSIRLDRAAPGSLKISVSNAGASTQISYDIVTS